MKIIHLLKNDGPNQIFENISTFHEGIVLEILNIIQF